MAKRVLHLQYGNGRSFLNGHVTLLGRDSHREFLVDDSKVVARRDLDLRRAPRERVQSVWPFQDFVLNGKFPDERNARQRGERELDETHRRFDD
ncbi:hypothetical protein [Alloyangia pacifica]|uniref:Uncharacterized protein n=1 Tax=Alloyangia pacifica TaxID=311180 RepID=A0A1I6RJB7_9RHOB|nr:hypothetical protein [Alloyangia pacifica]SDG52245.1 hypothetical protein SAMN04488245_103135 [Alloyangia pacifica]SFS64853.1 hypothetical protein SAMN04488050_103135 [Alloyangia pacifica]